MVNDHMTNGKENTNEKNEIQLKFYILHAFFEMNLAIERM